MRSYLKFAHRSWAQLLRPYDTAIDATCGNGNDTLKLAQLLPQGQVIAIDIQKEAIERARQLTSGYNVNFYHQSHAEFPNEAYLKPIRLIVYNLGYLPGGDKSQITKTEETLRSFEKALELIAPGGIITITCYPGHPGWQAEKEAILRRASTLSPNNWRATAHSWSFKATAPSLLMVKKRNHLF